MDRISKWLAACEEENWLEEYSQVAMHHKTVHFRFMQIICGIIYIVVTSPNCHYHDLPMS